MKDRTRIVMRLGFDPTKTVPEAINNDLALVFANDTARTVYLLWRRNHIIDETFPLFCLQVANRIDEYKPTDLLDLGSCFPRWCGLVHTDLLQFAKDLLPFLTGEKEITYEIVEKSATELVADQQ